MGSEGKNTQKSFVIRKNYLPIHGRHNGSIASALFFGRHHQHAISFVKGVDFPQMISRSHFCRRVHKISNLIVEISLALGNILKDITAELQYIMDSFPVAACD